jgi:hypothetical protein
MGVSQSIKTMNIYLLTQTQNTGYDTYDSVVVIAPSEEEAKTIHPEGQQQWGNDYISSWCQSPSDVTAKLVGTALPNASQGIILSSFNAG